MTTGTVDTALRFHLVAHTHWDREWYRPAAQFRQRLIALIDELLDAGAPSPFLLDGQAAVLEDYLEVRPERTSDLSARLRAGSLEAGPWFTLPDELIPSGEGLVRNLLLGRRVLRRLRAEPPAVLYCPDSFGHPAVLPTLALGFGCPVIVAWRGAGGASWPGGDTARWRAPDGSTALLHHLPRSGYEVASHLPIDADEARSRASHLMAELGPRSSLGIVLVPQGADHHAPQSDHAQAAVALARALGDRLHRSSLGSFGRELADAAANRRLHVLRGELRDSYGYTWTLGGTLGARAGQKRRYVLAERLLLRDTEPWLALRWLKDRQSRRALLDAAWRPLLLVQPHDTLCGCSIDDVARAADARIAESLAAAGGLRDEALDVLVGHDPPLARVEEAAWRPVVVVRNRAARRRSGVAEIELDAVRADVPVGPGSAGRRRDVAKTRHASLGDPLAVVQHLSRRFVFAREESPRHYPRNRLVERRRVLAWIEAVPALGMRLLGVSERARRAASPSDPARAAAGEIGNGRLRLVAGERSLSLLLPDGTTIPDWIMFEARGERGDLYTPSAIEGTSAVATLRRSRITARGPLRAEMSASWELIVPERALTSATGVPRSRAATRVRLRTTCQIDAGSSFIRVGIAGDWRAADARVRIAVRTGLGNPRVFADAAFGPVERVPIVAEPGALESEQPPPTAPLHRYVTLADQTRGCTVFSDGLTEYEAAADGTLYVTLRRSVGELSRAELPERPGHAGWPAETPEAQEPGPIEAMLAVMPHGPRRPAVIAAIEQAADDALLPLIGSTWRTAIDPPDFVEGIQLVGRGLAVSAIKESENGEWIALRCVNLLDETVSGAWRLPAIREACLARLDETPLASRSAQNGVLAFEAGPRAVVTLLVR